MKKFILSLFAIIFLVSCKNDEAYNNAVQKGLDYIITEEYQKSESAFELALDEKKNDEKATALLKQIVSYQELIKEFDEGDFDAARESAEEVIQIENGSSALIKKSEEILGTIEELKIALAEETEKYDIALSQFEVGEYDEASTQLDEISNEELTHPIFDSLKDDIEELQEEIGSAVLAEEKAAEEQSKAKQAEKERAESEQAKKEQAEAETKKKQNETKELSLDEMRPLAQAYVDEWNGYDNEQVEEGWIEESNIDGDVWAYYIFRDGDTEHHSIGVVVNPRTGEVRGDFGGID